MLPEIAYFQIFGKPLIFYMGMVTIFSFFATFSIPLLNQKTRLKIPIKWHVRFAYMTMVLALFHGILGVSGYL